LPLQSITEVGKSTPAGHDNNFNFLRLLFASLVIVSHGPELADGDRRRELLTRLFGSLSFGELAVSCFFLLSGYLIVSSWQRRPELLDYFTKRIRRIYPGYFVAFLLSVLVVGPLSMPTLSSYTKELNWHFLLGNLLQIRQPIVANVFPGTHFSLLNGAMWSISYEFRCYVLVILIGLVGAKYQKAIWLTLLLLAIGLLRMTAQLNSIHFPGMNYVIENLSEFVRLLTFFSAGSCFYLFRQQLPLKSTWAALAFGLFLLGLFKPALANIALATVGAYALFWLAFAQVPTLNWFKRKDDISYGLYLYGWPIQKLLLWFFPTASPWLLLLPALALAGLAGYLSWNLVEKRFLKRTSKTR
jgi:peptidoglycan/LPS O-acetylase OafA/YrhL